MIWELGLSFPVKPFQKNYYRHLFEKHLEKQSSSFSLATFFVIIIPEAQEVVFIHLISIN